MTMENAIRDEFRIAAADQVAGAIRKGKKIELLRQLEPFILESFKQGNHLGESKDVIFARICGEYFLSCPDFATAFTKCANELPKLKAAKGIEGPDAFVELSNANVGLYQKNKEGSVYDLVSKLLATMRKEVDKRDQAWNIQWELSEAASKLNAFMNTLWIGNGYGEAKPKKTKSAKGAPKAETVSEKTVNVQATSVEPGKTLSDDEKYSLIADWLAEGLGFGRVLDIVVAQALHEKSSWIETVLKPEAMESAQQQYDEAMAKQTAEVA
jgi:hypothetical protein